MTSCGFKSRLRHQAEKAPQNAELFLLCAEDRGSVPVCAVHRVYKQKGCTILQQSCKTDEGNVNSVSPLNYEAPCHAPSLLSVTPSAPAFGYSEYQLRYLYRGIAVVFWGYVEDRGSAPVCAFIMQKAFTLPILYCFYGRAASCLSRASRLP